MSIAVSDTPRTARRVVAAERILAKHTDRLVAVGEQVRNDLLDAGIGRSGQYAVIPPGTRLGSLPDRHSARTQLGLPADGLVVAFVGRLTRIKRPDRMVAVARQVIAAVPKTRFVVCGAGDLEPEVSSAANELGGSMSLLGWRADVETIYAAADLLLLTSDNEGMPVSLIEAALAGVPAVSTDVGSVAEVVQHNLTGILTQCDAGDLARSVVRLLRDNALRLRLGAAAAVWSRQQFGPDRLVRDVQHLYEAIALEQGWWPDARKMPRSSGPQHAQTLDGATL